MDKPIYLDYNGTTPVDSEVTKVIRLFIEDEFGNPSSSHFYGIEPKRAIMNARRQVASLLGCKDSEIIFTSGGTESNNLAILGILGDRDFSGKKIITSAIEHPAILEPLKHLEALGLIVDYLKVDEFGCVDPSDVESCIDENTILITIMHSNNEVGSIQPIKEIGIIARANQIPFHTDASQSVGKVQCMVDELGVDMLTVAGHKLYAPKGVGALYVRQGVELRNLLYGAGQEGGRRPGTENVCGIVGLGKACEIAQKDLQRNLVKIGKLRDRFKKSLMEKISDLKLNGHPQRSLPNTLNISFKGVEANRILEEIGLEVAASSGAACHSDHIEISYVLDAMKVPIEYAKGALRFSLGKFNTEQEIDHAANVVYQAVNKLRNLDDQSK
ncbi:MAG: cysteine desulfurase family protein [Syntrophaceae bacterium]|nr:cysteine desulfurase family protein [Syntrophaceae bacterium]